MRHSLDETGGGVGVTTQYITGELSVLLGELQKMVPDERLARDVGRLRVEVEAAPFEELQVVALRAKELMRRLCSECLVRGDIRNLCRQATWGAELMEFFDCASLLQEGEPLRQVPDVSGWQGNLTPSGG
jgi:hypothetical protein